ncbi:hypothetical protein [Lysobacter fragariae]
MSAQTFRFEQFFAPRKPRHRLLRVVFGLIGLALLALLVMFGLFVGAAMVVAGVVYKLWKQRGKPVARDGAIDAEYRVVTRPVLPVAR